MNLDNDFEENADSSQEKMIPIDKEFAADLICAGGALDRLNPDFEQRDSQVSLLENIVDCFNQDRIGVFEAGTGVGKSFSYLIPAILWVSSNNDRVVISTGTINLQQQIFEKDLPFAEKITGKKVKAVLLKGRQNFLCYRRYLDLVSENDLFTEEINETEEIGKWLKTTKTGAKADIPFKVSDKVWQRICSESDACIGSKCIHNGKCFVMKQRKESSHAQIIIVNHHLLFADIQMRMSTGFDDTAVLPPYRRLVCDEAHGLESAATSFFAEQFTRYKIEKQVRLLYRNRNGNLAGLYFDIVNLLTCPSDISILMKYVEDIEKDLDVIEERGGKLMEKIFAFRICTQNFEMVSPVLESIKILHDDLKKFAKYFSELINSLGEEEKKAEKIYEAIQVVRRLDENAVLCSNFTKWNEHPENVYWIEKGKHLLFHETPINVSDFLSSGVFDQMKTVVCTSATINIADSFNFWLSSVGIDHEENNRLLLGNFESPFPYDKNVLLAIPNDVPFPENPNFQTYLNENLCEFIRAAYGRTLVLFTSNDSMNKSYSACREALKDEEYSIMKQGNEDRSKLLDKFKNDVSSVLFATYSFWEGIDVPGESLSQVIIVKLPFGVPTDPVFASRCDRIEQQGGNSFMQLSVPESIIKFKQGFGRLLRRTADYGVVTVLDRRLIEKFYGQAFIKSLPETKMTVETTKEICKNIERFLG